MDKLCQEYIMSIQRIETFGEKIRKLRENNEMPLRKLAALLDIDQSTLSKIERSERKANNILINKIAKVFKVDKKELQVCYLSDKVAYDLLEEEYGKEVLQMAEQKITYLKKQKK